ncbi:MAG TPA: hypothetical protein VK960_01330 [Acidimicrobiia bacterium]|nr:hypothetical protein [Acidimicrobiia bacterium]
MAQVAAPSGEWLEHAVASPEPAARAGLETLPREWTIVDQVKVDELVVDHVVVGPNGVFVVSVDPDPVPAVPGEDGIYRSADRVTTPVKDALMAAHRLRRGADGRLFAYPILVATIVGEPEQLDRLGVVPGDRIAEYIWSHPGLPLRRSERHQVLWGLRQE